MKLTDELWGTRNYYIVRTYMSEAIPLSTALCIHGIRIVVSHIRNVCFDFVLEYFTTECRRHRYIKRKANGES